MSEVIRRRETTSGTVRVGGRKGERRGGQGVVVGGSRKDRGRRAAETPFGNSTFENSESHLKFAPRSRHLSHFPYPRTLRILLLPFFHFARPPCPPIPFATHPPAPS